MRRFVYMFLAVLLSSFWLSETLQAAPRLQETSGKTVIVIDPGHGGENRGTIENNHEEKLMTMTTALAMYEELLLYDDVEVYLTRTEDTDMSLKERAAFAQSVDADFLFSIHYNASVNHEIFGSEVWVSSVSPYNGYGYQFGYEFLSDMKDMADDTRCQDPPGKQGRRLLRYYPGVGCPGYSGCHHRTLPCGRRAGCRLLQQ